MKKAVAFLISLILVVGVLVGCSQPEPPANDADSPAANAQNESEHRAALILGRGGLGDQSFNDLTYEGVKRAEQELGVPFDYVEPKEIADFESYERDMAESGKYDVIICVGFESRDSLTTVAAEYPNQKFAIIDSEVPADNVTCYLSKEEEGSFLVGALAGLMNKDDNYSKSIAGKQVTGIIGGMDSPLIRKFVAGYTAGARYVNPGMQVLVDYVGDWADTVTAKEMALAMNKKGADIVYHAAGGSGLGVFEAAQAGDFYAIGCNSNQNHIAPDFIVASMMKRVDNATYNAVRDASEGTLKAGVVNLGVADGGIGYALEKSNIQVKQETIDLINGLQEKIKNGELVIPQTVEEVESWLATNQMK